ncbi:MAG: 50S ribosomal protein L23 [Candidatus Dasytiphilus stammeri]
MISDERLMEILHTPHLSEKASICEKNHTMVFKVARDSSKLEIKLAIKKIFNVTVIKVNTLIVKGKKKRYGKYPGKKNNWKKAYITLHQDHKINISNPTEKLS